VFVRRALGGLFLDFEINKRFTTVQIRLIIDRIAGKNLLMKMGRGNSARTIRRN